MNIIRKITIRSILLATLLPVAVMAQADAVAHPPVALDSVAHVVARDSVAVGGNEEDTVESGRFFWIPDSLADDVLMLLDGRHRVVRDESKLDLEEKVSFRGDTINMILRDHNPKILRRYNRGLFNYLYIPKGQWMAGLTASYGEFSTDNLEMFDLLSDFSFKGSMFSVKPYISYFIGNNMSVGLRFNYTNGHANLDSFALDIDEDMSFNIGDVGYRAETYEAAVFFTQYIGLSRRGRFGIFNEVALAFSSGNSDFNRPYEGEMRTTHTTNMKASLNFSPGVCIFVMKNVSFNLSFGVFGFYLKNERQTVNGERLGNRFTSGANFRFNIFNINFGLGFHF